MTRRNVFKVFGLAVAGALLPTAKTDANLSDQAWLEAEKAKMQNQPPQAIVGAGHPFFAKVQLTDTWSRLIPMCYSWNMDTEIAGVYLSAPRKPKGPAHVVAITHKSGVTQAATANAYLPGCVLRWKDGTRVTREEVISGVRA